MAERYASLPMYDLAELRVATNGWWAGLARHFRIAGVVDVPDSPTRPGGGTGHWAGGGIAHWAGGELLLSQTCGYPLATELTGRVRLVATPCYDAPGCDGPRYCSLIVVHGDSPARQLEDLRGGRCAVSSVGSWSGHHALRVLAAPLCEGAPFFRNAVASGGHAASIAMVAAGEADLAAIDCVTFALMAEHAPDSVVGVRVLCRTGTAPGLPLITRLSATDGELRALRDGLAGALADPALADTRAMLRIAGMEVLSEADYSALLDLTGNADRAGMESLI